MRIKCLAQGHYCHCQQIWTGDLTVESLWSYPLSHVTAPCILSDVETTNAVSDPGGGGGGGRRIGRGPPFFGRFFFFRPFSSFFFACHPGGRSGRRTVPLPNNIYDANENQGEKMCRSGLSIEIYMYTIVRYRFMKWLLSPYQVRGKKHP